MRLPCWLIPLVGSLLLAAATASAAARPNSAAPTSGHNGSVTVPLVTTSGLGQDAQGRVLVLGFADTRGVVVALTASGFPDPTFGQKGFDSWPAAEITKNGRPVATFAKSGLYLADPRSCLRGASGLAGYQGRIVVAALQQCRPSSAQTIAGMELKSNGAVDASFAHAGVAIVGRLPLTASITTPLAIAHSDVLLGLPIAGGQVEVAALSPSGRPDVDFGKHGNSVAKVANDSSFWRGSAHFGMTNVELFGGAFGSLCASFVQLPSFKLVAAGGALVRLYPSGYLDPFHALVALPGFGPQAGTVHHLLVGADGRLFVATSIRNGVVIGAYHF